MRNQSILNHIRKQKKKHFTQNKNSQITLKKPNKKLKADSPAAQLSAQTLKLIEKAKTRKKYRKEK